jgi:hypothetical protein
LFNLGDAGEASRPCVNLECKRAACATTASRP